MTYLFHKKNDPSCECNKCEKARERYLQRNEIQWTFGHFDLSNAFGVEHPSELGAIERPLEVRIAADITELTTGLKDFVGKEELPSKADLSRYIDAYEYAVKHCIHASIPEYELFYATKVYCSDCNKYLTKSEVAQSRRDDD